MRAPPSTWRSTSPSPGTTSGDQWRCALVSGVAVAALAMTSGGCSEAGRSHFRAIQGRIKYFGRAREAYPPGHEIPYLHTLEIPTDRKKLCTFPMGPSSRSANFLGHRSPSQSYTTNTVGLGTPVIPTASSLPARHSPRVHLVCDQDTYSQRPLRVRLPMVRSRHPKT